MASKLGSKGLRKRRFGRKKSFVRGADYHRGILAWLPEIWSMQQEAGVEGGEFDDENDINKSYHDLCVETA